MAIATRRVNLLLVVLAVVVFAYGGKLFYVQVANSSYYRALAQGQQSFVQETQGERGSIFATGRGDTLYVLASSQRRVTCYLDSSDILSSSAASSTAQEAARLFDISPEEITSRLSSEEQERLVLANDCSREHIIDAQKKELPGFEVEGEAHRSYPHDSLAANALGFYSQNRNGQYGVEGFFNKKLAGEHGLVRGEQNPWGLSLGTVQNKAQAGADIILSIDYNIQRKADQLLQKAVERHNAEGGQIVVADPRTGKIRALAETPDFNPNEYESVENAEIYQNGVVQQLFEPGSIFKPFVMAAGLSEDVLTPETTYTDQGEISMNGYTIKNYDNRRYDTPTMREVLAKSINTGAVFAERTVGHEVFLKYLRRFGFFSPTGVEIQGEVFSRNKVLNNTNRDINFATAAFGQGIEVTPAQVIQAFTAIANDGDMMELSLVSRIIEEGGDTRHVSPAVKKHNVISEDAARQLTSMLVSVVEDGYGQGASIEGYEIAGKTGTAQVPWSALGQNRSGYSDKTVQSFVGYFPAYDPQMLILTKLNNPAAKNAGQSAVPLFQDIAKYIIEYKLIPPAFSDAATTTEAEPQ